MFLLPEKKYLLGLSDKGPAIKNKFVVKKGLYFINQYFLLNQTGCFKHILSVSLLDLSIYPWFIYIWPKSCSVDDGGVPLISQTLKHTNV